jgi:uncharacterized protein involved in outer membrane biogenesis
MRRIFLITVSTLALLLLVLAGTVYYLLHDQEWIKGQVEDLVSELSGRQFKVDGPLEIALSLNPTITAGQLNLANAEWAQNTRMVELDRLSFSVNLASLFADRVIIHFIKADGLTVNLAENDNGDVNGEFFPSADDDVAATDPPMEQLPVTISQLFVTQLVLNHDAPGRVEPLDLLLSELQAHTLENDTVELSASGAIDGLPLSLEGGVGPLEHLVTGGTFNIKSELSLGEIDLSADGHLDEIHGWKGMDIAFRLEGPEFTWLTHHFALPDFSTGSFDFQLLLDSEANETAIDLIGDLGSLDINVNGTVDDLFRPAEGQLDFEITGPDLNALAEAFGASDLPVLPYRLQGDVSAHLGAFQVHEFHAELGENSGRVSGQLGSWPELQGTELDFVFKGPDLSQWGPMLGVDDFSQRVFNLSGRFSNHESGTVLTTVRLESDDSYIEIGGSLGPAPEFFGSALKVDLEVPDLRQVAVLSKHADLPALPLSIHGSVGRNQSAVLLNEFELRLGNDQAVLDGEVSLQDEFHGSQLNVKAEIESAAALALLFEVQSVPDFPVSIDADVSWSESGLKWVNKEASYGQLSVSLDGILAQPQTFDGASFAFQLAVPDLQQLPLKMELQNLPSLPARIRGTVSYQDRTIELSKVSGAVGDAGFEFDFRLTNQDKYTGSYLDFRFWGSNLNEFLAGDIPRLPVDDFKAAGKLELGLKSDQIRGLEMELGRLQIRVDGTVDDLTNITSADVSASVSGPDLSRFSRFAERDLPELPFSLNAKVSGTEQVFDLNPFAIELGPSNIGGNLRFNLLNNPVIEGKLRSQFLDLAWLMGKEEEASDEDVEVAEAAVSNKVFPDTRIPALEVGGMELELDLAVERLRLDVTELNAVALELSLHENLLKLSPFQFSGPLGEKAVGKLIFGGDEEKAQLDFVVSANDFRFGVGAAEGQDINTFPPTDVNIDVVGSGATYHELASSLNGNFRIVQGKGLIANGGLDLIFSDLLSELFATLNPYAKKSEYTQLECSLINAKITSGNVLVKPLIFQTEQLTIFSGGLIDLNTEKMSLDFETKLRKGIGLSAGMAINPFIRLGGSLSSPGIELDPAGVAITGGVAVATAGLSLVGKSLWDRFLTSKDPCGKALKKLQKLDQEEK